MRPPADPPSHKQAQPMQLLFPDGDHPDVPLADGITAIGCEPGNRVVLRAPGVAPRHVVIALGPAGLWLQAVAGDAGVHINGRPVRESALLRAGDLVCIARVRVLLRSDFPPPAPSAQDAEIASDPVDACRHLLRGIAGGHNGRTFVLSRPLVIGRDPHADLHLAEPALAPHHALIERGVEGVRYRQLGDGPMLAINGWEVAQAALCHGDQLVCAEYRFVLELPAAQAHRAEAAASAEPAVTNPGPGGRALRWGWLGPVLAAAAIAAVVTLLLL